MEDMIFPMNGGNGDYCYAKNSQIQNEASEFSKEINGEAIMEKLELKNNPTTVNIADFGCSVGPNTFFAVENLIQSVKNKFHNDLIQFQVFFSDHISNDFNTLFASLPPDRDMQYYAAGVPGSFHGRLFPRASITLAHSSYALQWLSRIPESVISSNKERIFYVGESKSESRNDDMVLRAYSEQFETDIGDFMSARAEEMVSGGLMFLIIPGICDGGNHVADFPLATTFYLLHSSLMDLVAEGVINKGEIERLNIPMYYPNVGEVRKIIEENGCFIIEKATEMSNIPNSNISARALMSHMRAGTEAIFKQHFGESATDKMFAKTFAKLDQRPNSRLVEDDHYYRFTHLFYVLKRK